MYYDSVDIYSHNGRWHWAEFLSDIAPIITRLDIQKCYGRNGPTFDHLEPLISSSNSFSRLQSIKLLYPFCAGERRNPDEAFNDNIWYIPEDWFNVSSLCRLTALPSLRDIVFVVQHEPEANNDFACEDYARLLINLTKKIRSDRAVRESPLLMGTVLDLARQAGD